MSGFGEKGARAPRRHGPSIFVVVPLVISAVLMSGWVASPAAGVDVTRSVAAPAPHLLGLPMGTAVWVMVGVFAVLVGSVVAYRNQGIRTQLQGLPISGVLADQEGAVASP